jgi:hypothetical protein
MGLLDPSMSNFEPLDQSAIRSGHLLSESLCPFPAQRTTPFRFPCRPPLAGNN